MEVNKNLLPIGITSFKNLITTNKIYVDKTDLIASFVATDKFYFLSRPRRFGKSTLVDILQELFSNGLTCFKDLKIAKHDLWHDKTYKVLHLDFLDLQNEPKDSFANTFKGYLQLKGEALDLLSIDNEYKDKSLAIFLEKWFNLIKEPIVLLIDEYDAPLTASLNCKEDFKVRKEVISTLFSKIKSVSSSGIFRFVFITGITRFGSESIFTGLNNLVDLTFNPKYGTLLGYTQEELEYYFKDYIENAAISLNKKYHTTEYNYNVIVQKLKEHYDGYSFDREALTHVYNPWSILNFLNDPKSGFKNYWLDSAAATPILLVNYLKSRDISGDKEVLDNYINLDFTKTTDETNLSPALVDISDENFSLEAVLYQAGYLSIKTSDGEDFNIGIPNLEVKKAYSTVILKSLLNKKISDIRIGYRQSLENSLEEKDLEKLQDTLNKYLNEFSYNFYKNADEIRYREIIKILLTLLSISSYSEVESSKGRCDLQISYKDKLYVIEFKLAHHENEIDDKLNEAIAQMKDRQYDNLLRSQSIISLAIVLLDKKAEEGKSAIHEIAKITKIN